MILEQSVRSIYICFLGVPSLILHSQGCYLSSKLTVCICMNSDYNEQAPIRHHAASLIPRFFQQVVRRGRMKKPNV